MLERLLITVVTGILMIAYVLFIVAVWAAVVAILAWMVALLWNDMLVPATDVPVLPFFPHAMVLVIVMSCLLRITLRKRE